jgi:hypothetical protein
VRTAARLQAFGSIRRGSEWYVESVACERGWLVAGPGGLGAVGRRRHFAEAGRTEVRLQVQLESYLGVGPSLGRNERERGRISVGW